MNKSKTVFKHGTDSSGKAVRNLLLSNDSKFFTVGFYKKDNTFRTMTARLGVQKNLKGGVSGTAEYEKYLTVFSVKDNGYRNINCETVKRIKMLGAEINIKN